MTTPAQLREIQAEGLTEKQLLDAVRHLAHGLGWLVYHTHDSRRSEAGFPDLVLVRDRIIYRELKSQLGRVTPAQEEWIAWLTTAGGDAGVWRPRDLFAGSIASELSLRTDVAPSGGP